MPLHTVNPIPGTLSFEQAACLGVPCLTAAMTLWKYLGVPMPSEQKPALSEPGKGELLLVWGGSTVTGQFAIQLAAQSGMCTIAVSSQQTKPTVEALAPGHVHVVTRDGKTNEQIVDEIRAVGGNRITKCIDLVGAATAGFSIKALSTDQPSSIAPLSFMAKGQEVPPGVHVINVEMKTYILDPESQKYAAEVNRLLGHGKLRIPQIALLKGLESVPKGLDILKRGDMVGKKLVIHCI